MNKASELAGLLNGLATDVEAVDASVQALVAAAGNDTLNADTQAALDRLTGDVGKLKTDATPAPAPSPAPAPEAAPAPTAASSGVSSSPSL